MLGGLTPVALNLKSVFARRGCGVEGFFGETEGGCQGVKCIYVQCFTAASAQGFAISLRDPRVKRINTRIMKRSRRVGIRLKKYIDVCLGCAVRLGERDPRRSRCLTDRGLPVGGELIEVEKASRTATSVVFGPKEVVEPQQQAVCDWHFVCGLERARNIQRVANRNQVVGFNVELPEGAFPNWEDPTKTRILKDKEV